MKRIDKETERKLFWLFIPMALVVLAMILELWFGINLPRQLFGLETDVLRWIHPALIVSVLIVFGGYGIAAARQKCWGELACALVLLLLMLLNFSNVFVDLLLP